MSSHLELGAHADAPLTDFRSERPFHSGRIHTCTHNDDIYALPSLLVYQRCSDICHTALVDGWS